MDTEQDLSTGITSDKLAPENDIPELGGSIADRLRQSHRDAAANKTYDLDIPGYNGELFCKYRLLSGDEIEANLKKVKQQTKERSEIVLATTLDNLITACQEFYLREDGREYPLREHPDVNKDYPITYETTDLAEFLQYTDELPERPTARSVVLGLFGGSDLRASAHGAELARWMMGSGAEVDALLGAI